MDQILPALSVGPTETGAEVKRDGPAHGGLGLRLAVGRALQIGKAQAMKIAKTNRTVGATYNSAMGTWLKENDLDGVTAQERYCLLLILDKLR